MQLVLDRVLDRDDVLVTRRVDVIDHRRQRRGLARAGRPGDEDEAAGLGGERGQDLRKSELAEVLVDGRNPSECHAHCAALPERIDPEAPDCPVVAVGEVGLVGLLEGSPDVVGHDLLEVALDVDLIERHEVGRLEITVDANDRRQADLQVEIRRLRLRRGAEECVDRGQRLGHGHPLGFGHPRYRPVTCRP